LTSFDFIIPSEETEGEATGKHEETEGEATGKHEETEGEAIDRQTSEETKSVSLSLSTHQALGNTELASCLI
jgi:hypothetical protein